MFLHPACPVCLADESFDDPFSNDDIGYFAVPLPPRDVQFGHSAALNVDGMDTSSSFRVNDRQGMSSVIYSDVTGSGREQGHKVDFSTMSYVVLLLIVACNAVVCSWHAMKNDKKEAMRGYLSGHRVSTKIIETDVSDVDEDEYRTSSDLENDDVDDFTDDESDEAAL